MTVLADVLAEQAATRGQTAPPPSGGRGDRPVSLRRNYAAHGIEGGLFMGALAFVNANTLLPTIVQSLHGPTWLISLMPVMMYAGLLLPPILTAHLIERMSRYMPLLLITGIFQRLPYLLAAWALFSGIDNTPWLALAAVALAPLLSGIAGGISLTAWQQLVVKTVPENRRSSMFAIRYILFCFIGIAAGYAVKVVLLDHPGAVGYGVLHLVAFVMLMGSYFVFALIREPPPEAPVANKVGFWQNLAAMPALVRADRCFALYLGSRFFRNGMFVLTPFLAIYFQERLGQSESYLGQLLIVQMVGAILGCLVAGWVGDRQGGKITMIGGSLLFAIISAWACRATSNVEFQTIFFLFGVAFYASEIGTQILGLEICPERNRSSYLALISLVTLPGMLAASWISAVLWEPHRRFTALAILTVVSLLLSVLFLLPLKEPRRKGLVLAPE